MKSTRHQSGYYTLTGYMRGSLTQYSVMNIGGFWAINRTYGNGPEFHHAYKTKSEAIKAVNAYND